MSRPEFETVPATMSCHRNFNMQRRLLSSFPIFRSLSSSANRRMTSNIIDAIKQDHDHIRNTYQCYKSERDPKERQKYANELVRRLVLQNSRSVGAHKPHN